MAGILITPVVTVATLTAKANGIIIAQHSDICYPLQEGKQGEHLIVDLMFNIGHKMCKRKH